MNPIEQCSQCGKQTHTVEAADGATNIYCAVCRPGVPLTGHHLTSNGVFKSDKYDWCPEGFFAIAHADDLGYGSRDIIEHIAGFENPSWVPNGYDVLDFRHYAHRRAIVSYASCTEDAELHRDLHAACIMEWEKERLAPPPGTTATGTDLIVAERKRQITQEGWTAEHDDAEHGYGALAQAAACYAAEGEGLLWPWHSKWDKRIPRPINVGVMIQMGEATEINLRIRELAKAGALCAAEIDRLTRARDDIYDGD